MTFHLLFHLFNSLTFSELFTNFHTFSVSICLNEVSNLHNFPMFPLATVTHFTSKVWSLLVVACTLREMLHVDHRCILFSLVSLSVKLVRIVAPCSLNPLRCFLWQSSSFSAQKYTFMSFNSGWSLIKT